MYEKTREVFDNLVIPADQEFWRSLLSLKGGKQGEEDFVDAVKKYNGVLELAMESLYEDTKNVNSRDTIYQIYKAKKPTDTHFGENPLEVIRKLIQAKNAA